MQTGVPDLTRSEAYALGKRDAKTLGPLNEHEREWALLLAQQAAEHEDLRAYWLGVLRG